MHFLQRFVANQRVHGQLLAAAGASIDIHPFQLEPALAIVRGRSARVLLADEVGLGKTIQASLIVAELQRRGWCQRALVLSPAGLCHQWASELDEKFGITSTIFDAATLRRRSATLPFGVNPWAIEPVVVTSIDFIKQPEVATAITSLLWDVVIVDEAHQAAVAPHRAAAVRALTRRARHVILISATPHAGSDDAFRSLCEIGRMGADDPLLLFRRTRSTTGQRTKRRVHLLRVRCDPRELEMHRLLAEYAAMLWRSGRPEHSRDAQLAALVMSKRAMSSASSLVITLRRRLSVITGCGEPSPIQTELPLGSIEEHVPGDAEPEISLPAIKGVDEERALRTLIDAAEAASTRESKVQTLCRLIRRVREPVIIFTEYRDTLEMLERSLRDLRPLVQVHGGMTIGERHAAIRAFNAGAAGILLATDAGSEGLNLQSRCRFVVNLELPWNPMRLEQRIGRVDRIGQTRTVHAVHLFACDTAEATVLANLHRRIGAIRASEIEIAACVIDGRDLLSFATSPAPIETWTISEDFRDDAKNEGDRLGTLHRFTRSRTVVPDPASTAVTFVRARAASSAREMVWVFGANIISGHGRLVEEVLVPVSVQLLSALSKTSAFTLIERLRPFVLPAVREYVAVRAADISRNSTEWVARAMSRERQMLATLDAGHLFQASLFDRRSIRDHEELRTREEHLRDEIDQRVRQYQLEMAAAANEDPILLLVLVRC